MESLATMYINRDNSMNLNSYETIINHLKKLGYYNIDETLLENQFIKKYLKNEIDNNCFYIDENKYIFNKNMNDIFNSVEYIKFKKNLEYKILRYEILSKINSLEIFYTNCTEDELIYLGY